MTPRERKEMYTSIVGSILLASIMAIIAIIARVAPASDTVPGALIFLLLIVAGLCLYLLPAIIAFGREHQHRVPILLTNLFFGWTFIGWVLALIWSAMPVTRPLQQS